MNRRAKQIAVPALLSGLWGVAVYLLTLTPLYTFPFAGLFFYPILLTGPVLITTAYCCRGGSYTSAALAGLLSGLIYQLVSPLFPLLASVLTGASLGGGLSHGRGGFVKTAFSAMKGVAVFTVLIALGGLFGYMALYLTGSFILYWFFWGALLGTGVSFLVQSEEKAEGKERGSVRGFIPYEELRAETSDIKRELDELGR